MCIVNWGWHLKKLTTITNYTRSKQKVNRLQVEWAVTATRFHKIQYNFKQKIQDKIIVVFHKI